MSVFFDLPHAITCTVFPWGKEKMDRRSQSGKTECVCLKPKGLRLGNVLEAVIEFARNGFDAFLTNCTDKIKTTQLNINRSMEIWRNTDLIIHAFVPVILKIRVFNKAYRYSTEIELNLFFFLLKSRVFLPCAIVDGCWLCLSVHLCTICLCCPMLEFFGHLEIPQTVCNTVLEILTKAVRVFFLSCTVYRGMREQFLWNNNQKYLKYPRLSLLRTGAWRWSSHYLFRFT